MAERAPRREIARRGRGAGPQARPRASIAVAVCAACLIGACALFQPRDSSFPAGDAYAGAAVSSVQERIVKGGLSLIGAKRFTVSGRSYPSDCTGLVRAAYAFADIDLAARFGEYPGNGVRRLYRTLEDAELLYATRYPAPADLVFWDGTYDVDGDGRGDDELTHVGLVLSAEPDGTIRYLHYHYRLGPVIERMNLTRPNDDSSDGDGRVNAFMRMRSAPASRGDNAAQLWKAFGKGYELVLP